MPGLIKAQNNITISSAASLFPHKPPGLLHESFIDFSQIPVQSPPANNQVDNPIPGSTWLQWGFNTNWSRITDLTAPVSPPYIWDGAFPAGTYGGGIGQGPGTGFGNIFTYDSGILANPSYGRQLYASIRAYFAFPSGAANWHPVSNKWINIETTAGSLILVQLNEGGKYLHCEELSNSGDHFIDSGDQPGRLNNNPVPTNQWTTIEFWVDIANFTWQIWLDGIPTTSTTTFPFLNQPNSRMRGFGINGFRGGGGEVLLDDLHYRYDHMYVAW